MGHAANFVETEHVFSIYNPTLAPKLRYSVNSHVQIRGSIPLMWTMTPNMKWAPPVVVASQKEDSLKRAHRHIIETKAMYGGQYWVNLIDKKGG